jgi:hypothetical protein
MSLSLDRDKLMPSPDPIISSFKAYLKKTFSLPTKEPWLYRYEIATGEYREIIVQHHEVKEALRKLGLTDPWLSRLLDYMWRSHRSRDDIAASIGVDPSTVNRRWHLGIYTIFNWLFNGDVCIGDELAPVDLILRENYSKGMNLNEIIDKIRDQEYKKALQDITSGKIPLNSLNIPVPTPTESPTHA